MKFTELSLQDVYLIEPKVFEDNRGFFFESFRQNEFEHHCGKYEFVQDNHSFSSQGTLRGLHYQYLKPQGKLIRVITGKVLDVLVDLRLSSRTYGKWLSVELSSKNKKILWAPPGFAHGFLVLSSNADFVYKCTDYYNPGDEYSLLWDDEEVGIQWPNIGCEYKLSRKDSEGAKFKDLPKFEAV